MTEFTSPYLRQPLRTLAQAEEDIGWAMKDAHLPLWRCGQCGNEWRAEHAPECPSCTCPSPIPFGDAS